jgi:hypothetical protein
MVAREAVGDHEDGQCHTYCIPIVNGEIRQCRNDKIIALFGFLLHFPKKRLAGKCLVCVALEIQKSMQTFLSESLILFLSPAPYVLTQSLSTITFSGRSNLVRRSLEKRRKKYKLKKENH